MEGHAAPHTCHDGQIGRRHTRTHEEYDVLVTYHGKARHKFPEASLCGPVSAVEGVNHDVAVPSSPEARDSVRFNTNMHGYSIPSLQRTRYVRAGVMTYLYMLVVDPRRRTWPKRSWSQGIAHSAKGSWAAAAVVDDPESLLSSRTKGGTRTSTGSSSSNPLSSPVLSSRLEDPGRDILRALVTRGVLERPPQLASCGVVRVWGGAGGKPSS